MNYYKEILSKIKLGDNRCWIWQGSIKKQKNHDYPVLHYLLNRIVYAHRASGVENVVED